MSDGQFVPLVIDHAGNRLSGPEMEAVAKMVTDMAQLAQLAHIRIAVERRQIKGGKISLSLQASDETQVFDIHRQSIYFPDVPWAIAHIINNGPSPVWVAVNNQWDYTQILANASLPPLDFTESEERIKRIYYKCDRGGRATIQVVAIY